VSARLHPAHVCGHTQDLPGGGGRVFFFFFFSHSPLLSMPKGVLGTEGCLRRIKKLSDFRRGKGEKQYNLEAAKSTPPIESQAGKETKEV